MNKKIIYILLFFVSILSFLVGCENKEEEKSMQINITDVTMNVGDVINIEVSNASSDVTFNSSDENIAKVNAGVITAIAAGKATITVSDNDERLTCTVNVLSSAVEGAYIINLETDVVDLIIGDEYLLEPSLLHGLDVVEDAKFSFTSMDESIVTVENGKINALTVGETFVQIDAVDYEKTSKLIKVVVSSNFTIDLSESNLTLSKREMLDYITSKEVSYVVKDNGNVLNVDDITVEVSDDNIVSVEKVADKYLIKALNFGEAKVSFSYQKADGSQTVSYINIDVVKPVIKLDNEYYFSKVNGIVDFSQFDLSEYNLNLDANSCVKVTDELGNDFSITSKTDKKVAINSSSNIAENGESKKMYYDMGEYIFDIDIIQCTLAIRTVEDFISMNELLIEKRCDDGKMHKRIDGYIALVNDIDFEGYKYVPACGFLEINKDFGGRSGFSAIFEGNNKIIKNIKLGNENHTTWNSIFGNVGWDAEIRNLAIVDCTFDQGSAGAVISDYFHGTISNVFISATLNTTYTEQIPDYIEKKTNGFTIATPYKFSTIEEVTIVVKNTLPDNIYNNVVSGGPVYVQHTGTYNLRDKESQPTPIKSMLCIGGGDNSKLVYGYKSTQEINEVNGPNGYLISYETIAKATTAVIADNGSTSFDVVDDKLQIKFNGILVYNE